MVDLSETEKDHNVNKFLSAVSDSRRMNAEDSGQEVQSR
jgi:hypothetical protein